MSTRLCRLTFPAPLLPIEVAVKTQEDLLACLHPHGITPSLGQELWLRGNAYDARTGTALTCHVLTGSMTTCPHCARSVPEVVVGEHVAPWCSCTQGDLP